MEYGVRVRVRMSVATAVWGESLTLGLDTTRCLAAMRLWRVNGLSRSEIQSTGPRRHSRDAHRNCHKTGSCAFCGVCAVTCGALSVDHAPHQGPALAWTTKWGAGSG
ncbi:hypothetical protein TRVL_07117 [Trypanosoma vivax]|nr:hypothetical protein TRVL_07117 [Trypanosoma vivax]